jgi:antitoxin CptB
MEQIRQANPPVPRDLWLKRLTYRSWHRGCKETDLILGTYCDKNITTLGKAELERFEALLDEEDADIWAWLTGKTPCPKPEFAPLIAELQALNLHA